MSVYINVPPSGFFRYPDSGDAGTGSTLALTAGLVAANNSVNPKEIFPLRGAQGFQMMVGGAGANNDTADYRIWLVRNTYGVRDANQTNPVTGLEYRFFGSGTATFSATTTGPGGAASATAQRMADGLTFTEGTAATTPKGIGDALRTAYNASAVQVYTPAADGDPALLVAPHAGWADGIVIEFDPTGTSSGVFALIART